jgi:parallel beta-helix repeat protein
MSRVQRLARLIWPSLAVVPLALGLTAGSASAVPTTYVVDATASNCSNSGAGTSAQPFCTIGRGAAVAVAGDTVLVRAGTYAGTSVNTARSGTAGSPITLTANPGVTISGGTTAFAISSRSYVTVNGFTVTLTTGYGISASSSSNITISNNIVTYAGTPEQNLTAAGIRLSGTSSSLVTHNTSDRNSDHGILVTTGSADNTVSFNEASFNAEGWRRNANGIDIIGSGATGNQVIGNVVHDNEDSGLQFFSSANNGLAATNVTYNNGDHGIDDLNVTGGRLVGNTVYHNCTTGINVEGTSGSYLIENNVSMDNAVYPAYNGIACSRRNGNIGVWDSAPATTRADFNLVDDTAAGGAWYVWAGTVYNSQAALRAATGQEASGIFADPRFVNASAWNLQLTSGSPAIDAADTSAPGAQPADILGVSPYDDRGAYEYVSTGPRGPTASLGVSPASGTAPLAVVADASASVPGSSAIASYGFDFGDGTTVGPQSGSQAAHTYGQAGTFTASVTATDANGLASTATRSVTVSPAATGPTAALTVTPGSGTAPLAITADASASTPGSSAIVSYSFDFGDGSPVVGPQAAATAGHTYTAAGTFTAVVTVTDAGGLTSTAARSVTVSSPGTRPASYVGPIATNYSTSPHTSGHVAVWRPAGVAAGDLIVIAVELTGTTATGTVTGTDTAGDTLTAASDVSDSAGNRLVVLSGTARTALVAGDQVTISFPSAATYRITADEVAGVTAPDQSSSASGTASTFSSGSSGTTGRPGEFVFAATGTFGGMSIAWSAPWNGLTTYAVDPNALGRAYQVPAGTGSFTASGTASGTWLSTVVTFT